MQQRFGADKFKVVLIDVDPEYYKKPEEYLPKAKKILDKQKLDWPNTLAPKGFSDVVRTFNLSGYGNIVVDARGIVRGVNAHDKEFVSLVEKIMGASEAGKPEK